MSYDQEWAQAKKTLSNTMKTKEKKLIVLKSLATS